MRKTFTLIATALFIFYFYEPLQAQIFIEDFDGSNTTATTTIDMICGVGDAADYFGITNLTIASSVNYNGATGNFLGAQDTGSGASNCSLTQGANVNASIGGIDISGQAGIVICFDVAEDTAADGNEDWDGDSSFSLGAVVDGATGQLLFVIESSATSVNSTPGFDCDVDGLADGVLLTDVFTTFCAPLSITGNTLDINISINNLLAADEDIAIDNIAVYSDNAPAPNTNTGCSPVAPICSITNVTVTADGACTASDASYTVCADVSGGSGDYNLIDVDNANAIISSLTAQADGTICFDVTMTGPTTATSINVNVIDAVDASCLGQAVSVAIPDCPVVSCDAKIIKFPANGN